MKEVEWLALSKNDRRFDGQFFYGVSTTLIFCRPSCPSKVPLRQHVSIFLSQRAAIDAGYRPCKRCRPEVLSFVHSRSQIVNEAIEIIKTKLDEPLTLKKLAERLFVSPTYLQKVFTKEMKISPARFILESRMDQAKHLLRTTDLLICDIAQTVGYVNAAHFSTVFHRHTGESPTYYRTKVQ
ncbi:helix-turn-helix domain-containing protein [Paenisporosarcina quisquiliarum]|uniref:Helix-turn-helix domain-containing protein n=1 Tax=Paenisporosarcina quisquiliarum TaxID=365346 RepID=A0A9X3LHK6_9BACL|nr:Ada metal-binding domain-containing protein [Paenisporosarcina quisquiliarum]MCZ8538145.1 helix-turn-helix domain-containing protein [Paenisporosarcina quisquiliarum]